MARVPRRLVKTVRMITGQDPLPGTLRPAQRALFKRLRELATGDAIVGVGVSDKEIGGEGTGELGIVFYVEEKRGGADLPLALMVPPVILDAQGRAILTDVRAVGRVEAETNASASPIRSGFSVGHENGMPGTVTAIVQLGGRPHILSAKHVLADYGRGRGGDQIFYPARGDGGTAPASVVASLLPFAPYVLGGGYPNSVDAALAEVVAERRHDLDPALPGVAKPMKVVAPAFGMRVTLIGRSSSAGSTSTVKGLNAAVRPIFPAGAVGFADQVECTNYTAAGDSGGLVVAADTGAIVGMHIAGSTRVSYFTPFTAVRSALNFTF